MQARCKSGLFTRALAAGVGALVLGGSTLAMGAVPTAVAVAASARVGGWAGESEEQPITTEAELQAAVAQAAPDDTLFVQAPSGTLAYVKPLVLNGKSVTLNLIDTDLVFQQQAQRDWYAVRLANGGQLTLTGTGALITSTHTVYLVDLVQGYPQPVQVTYGVNAEDVLTIQTGLSPSVNQYGASTHVLPAPGVVDSSGTVHPVYVVVNVLTTAPTRPSGIENNGGNGNNPSWWNGNGNGSGGNSDSNFWDNVCQQYGYCGDYSNGWDDDDWGDWDDDYPNSAPNPSPSASPKTSYSPSPTPSLSYSPSPTPSNPTPSNPTPSNPVQTNPLQLNPATTTTVSYASCAEVEAAGKAPLLKGQAGYDISLDADGDGIACEANESTATPTLTPGAVLGETPVAQLAEVGAADLTGLVDPLAETGADLGVFEDDIFGAVEPLTAQPASFQTTPIASAHPRTAPPATGMAAAMENPKTIAATVAFALATATAAAWAIKSKHDEAEGDEFFDELADDESQDESDPEAEDAAAEADGVAADEKVAVAA